LNTGRFVSSDTVLRLMEERIDATFSELSSMTRVLVNSADLAGSIEEWQAAVMTALKNTHIELGVLGGGGYDAMTPAMWGKLGATLRSEYGYLNDFAGRILSGEMGEAELFATIRKYGDATWQSYWDVQTYAKEDAGFDLERYNLEPGAKHCPSCEDRAAQGFQPIGTLPEMCDTDCQSNDRCSKTYRNSVTGEEIDG